MMMIVLYTVALYLCGSLMFSYWLGLLAKKNLHSVGDGNPGPPISGRRRAPGSDCSVCFSIL
jgi:glycerol-3-phosphate acyltransferase PlsY